MRCPNCAYSYNPTHARLCYRCGYSLVTSAIEYAPSVQVLVEDLLPDEPQPETAKFPINEVEMAEVEAAEDMEVFEPTMEMVVEDVQDLDAQLDVIGEKEVKEQYQATATFDMSDFPPPIDDASEEADEAVETGEADVVELDDQPAAEESPTPVDEVVSSAPSATVVETGEADVAELDDQPAAEESPTPVDEVVSSAPSATIVETGEADVEDMVEPASEFVDAEEPDEQITASPAHHVEISNADIDALLNQELAGIKAEIEEEKAPNSLLNMPTAQLDASDVDIDELHSEELRQDKADFAKSDTEPSIRQTTPEMDEDDTEQTNAAPDEDTPKHVSVTPILNLMVKDIAEKIQFTLSNTEKRWSIGRTIPERNQYVDIDLGDYKGKGISRNHAEIHFDADSHHWMLTDLGSQYGTFLDEQQLSPNSSAKLESNQVIRMGVLEILVTIS